MNSDKILIIIASTIFSLIAITGFIFREEIEEDIHLYEKAEVLDLIEDRDSPSSIDFYPLTQKERAEKLKDHIEKMKVIQQRVSKTLFTKHFLDLSDYIETRKVQLEKNKIVSQFGPDALSFFTANLNSVVGPGWFSKEDLLTLGLLIDEAFPEEASNDALYYIGVEQDGTTSVCISPPDTYVLKDTSRYKKFINSVSKDVFNSSLVVLYVSIPNSERELVFKSKPAKLHVQLYE